MKNLAAGVRKFLKGLPKGRSFNPAWVGRSTGIDRAQVDHALADFLRRGEIQRVSSGRYEYAGVSGLWAKEAGIRLRLFRAMHVKGVFTAGEVAMLSDTDRDYTYKVIKRLVKSGDVEKTGQRKGKRGQAENVFSVKDKDGFFVAHLMPSEGKGLAAKDGLEGR